MSRTYLSAWGSSSTARTRARSPATASTAGRRGERVESEEGPLVAPPCFHEPVSLSGVTCVSNLLHSAFRQNHKMPRRLPSPPSPHPRRDPATLPPQSRRASDRRRESRVAALRWGLPHHRPHHPLRHLPTQRSQPTPTWPSRQRPKAGIHRAGRRSASLTPAPCATRLLSRQHIRSILTSITRP